MTEKNEDGKMPENGGDAASPHKESQCGHRAPGAEAGSGQEEEKTAAATEPAVREENAELEWSRRHVRKAPVNRPAPHLPRPPVKRQAGQPPPGKQQVQQKPGRSRQKQEVFRKTELHTRPPPATGWHITGITRGDLPGAEELADLFQSGSPECIRLLLKRQDDVSDDLYRQVAKVEEYLESLDVRLGQVTGRLERRIADLEDRGRWT